MEDVLRPILVPDVAAIDILRNGEYADCTDPDTDLIDESTYGKSQYHN